ncbi:phosphate ABC transporter permease PstA [Sphingomonas sabuli]|uniref:Phosphate transport system permease protein PstA n=1 Tax=Sphingomonas sabuli TaxID=2764186 RepID=A0A7G9L2F5_9SPHN|nr:phosphate ABC transporter permease PstA [Sphingomonas sabuli]QNM82804.1 phosphate ABC transporter permease PstA [Sphingomonas sabuli]
MNSAANVSPSERWSAASSSDRLRKRYASERRFRLLGLLAVAASAIFLAFLLVTMAWKGIGGFTQTEARLTIDFPRSDLILDPATLRGPDAQQAVVGADLESAIVGAATAAFGAQAEDMFGAAAVRALGDALIEDPTMVERRADVWLPVSGAVATAASGSGAPDAEQLVGRLQSDGALRRGFNVGFLTASDGTDPSAVGIWGALKGSMLTILVTMLLAFPVGVLAAVYLEEFAARNRWSDAIEVSINNLAAVPSIIFGLLGLAVFLNFMHLPRSAPLVGGLTLALMTMPVIVIAARNAIKSVPPSIRDAALGVGASRMQVVFHHVLPLALPGILTGTIIGMARALGETAPLLMIGMRAFIATPPGGITDPATVLPVQIFLWSDEVDRAFVEKTSAAIIVLLLFMLLMNGLAIYLRNRFERKW